jgi:hypothetical protein
MQDFCCPVSPRTSATAILTSTYCRQRRSRVRDSLEPSNSLASMARTIVAGPYISSNEGRRNDRQFWPTSAIKAAASHDGWNNVLPHRVKIELRGGITHDATAEWLRFARACTPRHDAGAKMWVPHVPTIAPVCHCLVGHFAPCADAVHGRSLEDRGHAATRIARRTVSGGNS